jgi:ATP-dependent helicase/nuclease subunit B
LPGFARTLVTPTIRLSRHQRRVYDLQQKRSGMLAWESPDILPVNGWLTRTWGDIALRNPQATPVLLDSSQEEALWEEAIRSVRSDDPLLNVHQTAVAAVTAWDLLHRWEASFTLSDFEGLEDTEAFFGWMTAVKARLTANGWIMSSELYEAVGEHVRNSDVSLAYVGFDDLFPAARRLFSKLKATEEALPFVQNHSLRRYLLHDQPDEWIQAASWARERLSADPAARIGVAIPGLRGVAGTVERIFDDVLHPSYSLGVPQTRRAFELGIGIKFSETPLISAALLILGLADELKLSDALTLLRSPFVRLKRDARLKLDQELRRQGLDTVSVYATSLKAAFPDLAREADAFPKRQSPVRWSATFSALLKSAGWGNGEALSEKEHHALRQWQDLLSRFARLGTVAPSMTLRQALERVGRLASSTVLHLPDEDAPIQIFDLSEASGLRFDALWVSGLDAAAWPRPIQPNPFLPVRLQRELGMPRSSPEREFAQAQRLTEQLKRSAEEVVFSSTAQTRDEKRLVSPLIEHIPLSNGFAPGWQTAHAVFLSGSTTSGKALVERPPDVAPPLPRDIVHLGGTKILENQSACPFKAFAAHRLNARELGEVPFGVSRLERGSVAHDALHHIWTELKDRDTLNSKTLQQIDSLLETAVNAGLEKQLVKRQRSKGIERFRALESARLRRVLLEWLDQERSRPRFTVVQTEVQDEIAIGGMRLNVRADRIDRYDDDSRAILDYKTGNKISKKSWEGERPDALQLPLYAVTHEAGRVSQIAFAKLTSEETKLIPLSVDRAILQNWRRILEGLAEEYLSGHAEVSPKTSATCVLCDLSSVCRIAERNGRDVEDVIGDGADE